MHREPRTARDGWIDVSVALHSGMVHWPDNPPIRIERMLDIEQGDAANVSKISMGSHTGTHMDAPFHFLREGKGLDEMPLDAAMGRTRVIAVNDPESVKPSDLREHEIRSGERILFKTQNSARSWPSSTFIETSSTCRRRRPATSPLGGPGRRHRLHFGWRVPQGRRRDTPGVARGRDLGNRGSRPLGGGARRVRARLPADQGRAERRRARQGDSEKYLGERSSPWRQSTTTLS